MGTQQDTSHLAGQLQGELLALAAIADTAADVHAGHTAELVKTLREIGRRAREAGNR